MTPEGAKTIILSYKTAAEAVVAVHMQNLKIGCFTYTHTSNIRVDRQQATTGGKEDPPFGADAWSLFTGPTCTQAHS
jgi:hypothetical protein